MKKNIHPRGSFCGLAALVAAVTLSLPAATAGTIAVPNDSFESPSRIDGGFAVFNIQGTNGAIQNWLPVFTATSGSIGTFNPLDFDYDQATGDTVPLPGQAAGFQHAFINNEGAIVTENPVATVQADLLYTLTVAIGNRKFTTPEIGSFLDPGLVTIELLIDGAVAATNTVDGELLIPDGDFVDLQTSFQLSAADPRVGGDLTIRLSHARSGGISGENEAGHFDNVRLTAVPEPTSAGLAVLGVLGLLVLSPRLKNK